MSKALTPLHPVERRAKGVTGTADGDLAAQPEVDAWVDLGPGNRAADNQHADRQQGDETRA